MKKIICLFLLLVLLLSVTGAGASSPLGVWRGLTMSGNGVYMDLKDAGYGLFVVILSDGEGYLLGGSSSRQSSVPVTYILEEPNEIVLTFQDGTREDGIYNGDQMYLTDSEGITSTLERACSGYSEPVKISRLEDLYGRWTFLWMELPDAPKVITQEILLLFGNDQFADFELTIDDSGLRFTDDESVILHPYLESGMIRISDDPTSAFELMASGELRMQVDDNVYYFARAEEKTGARGIYAEYTAKKPDVSDEAFQMLLDETVSLIRSRLDERNLTAVNVSRTGIDRIRLEIPSAFSDDLGMLEDILGMIGNPGALQFVDPTGNVIMDGSMVKSACYVQDDLAMGSSTLHQVEMTLTDEGRELFADATAKYIGQYVSVYLDGEMLINARVNMPITEGVLLVSGQYTETEAKDLAAKIQAGALPLVLIRDIVDLWK